MSTRTAALVFTIPFLSGAHCETGSTNRVATQITDQAVVVLEDASRLLTQVNTEVAENYRQATTAGRLAAATACGVADMPLGDPHRIERGRECRAIYDRIMADVEDWFAIWLRISIRMRAAIDETVGILRGRGGNLIMAITELEEAIAEARSFGHSPRPQPRPAPTSSIAPASIPVGKPL